MTHKQYVATLDKHEAKALIKAAQERVEELERGKNDAVAMLDAACYGREQISFFGQKLFVIGGKYRSFGCNSYEGPKWEFELDNGSKIVINLD